MLELGLDQAHGLKRIFRPESQGLIQILAISPNDSFGRAVLQVGRALGQRGFDVHYDDEERLLPFGSSQPTDAEGERLMLSVTRDHEKLISDPAQNTTWQLIAAPASPTHLPACYQAIKSIVTQSVPTPDARPVVVLWFADQDTDSEMQDVCQENLQITVERYLGQTIEHLKPIELATNMRPFYQHPFLENLSNRLLSSMGRIQQQAAH